jgi:hypothetical protein
MYNEVNWGPHIDDRSPYNVGKLVAWVAIRIILAKGRGRTHAELLA